MTTYYQVEQLHKGTWKRVYMSASQENAKGALVGVKKAAARAGKRDRFRIRKVTR